MKKGKDVCEELKRIRQEIADANEIEYTPHICTHEGDCAGSCPACEQEVRYLTEQLNNRSKLGKAISIVGISTCLTAMAPLLSSCGPQSHPTGMVPMEGDVVYEPDSCNRDSTEKNSEEYLLQEFARSKEDEEEKE